MQLFALLGIIGLNFRLLLLLNFSMLGIVGVWNRSIVAIEVCRALPLLHKVGWMSFLPISSHVVADLAEVWLDDLNIFHTGLVFVLVVTKVVFQCLYQGLC